jgi:hypothetical protein
MDIQNTSIAPFSPASMLITMLSQPNLSAQDQKKALVKTYQVLAKTNYNTAFMQKQLDVMQNIYNQSLEENNALAQFFREQAAKNQDYLAHQKTNTDERLRRLEDEYKLHIAMQEENINTLKSGLAASKNEQTQKDNQMTALQGQLNEALDKQVVMEQQKQQQLQDIRTAHAAKTNELNDRIAQEQNSGQTRQAKIEELNAELRQANALREADEARIQANHAQHAAHIQATQAHLAALEQEKRQLQAQTQRQQNQLDAAIAQQAAQAKEYERLEADLKQNLKTELNQMAAQNKAALEQQQNQKIAELAQLQQKHQDELNFKMTTMKADNTIREGLLQNQINSDKQEKQRLEGRINTQASQIDNLNSQNQQNTQKIIDLEAKNKEQAKKIHKLAKKAKKKRKFGIF